MVQKSEELLEVGRQNPTAESWVSKRSKVGASAE